MGLEPTTSWLNVQLLYLLSYRDLSNQAKFTTDICNYSTAVRAVDSYCNLTSTRCATKISRIFKIANLLVHELISATNNSRNQIINVGNISEMSRP